MTTTTATNAGAPAGATDAKAGSSTATPASPDTRSASTRMADGLRASRKAQEGKRSPESAANPTTATAAADDGVQPKADAALPEGDTAKADQADAEKGKKEPDTVPLKAFKARLHEVNEKVRVRTEERDAAQMKASRTEAALKLLSEEFEAYKQSVKSGRIPDERDEQLRQHDLERRAREASEQIARGADEAKKKAQAEERAQSIRARVDREIEEACEQHDLIDAPRLKHELQRVWKTNPRASIAKVAAAMQEALIQKAKARLVPPTPPAPTTVQDTSHGSSVRFESTPKGMAEQLRARRAARASA